LNTIGIIGHENPALVRATLSHVLAKLSSTFPNAKILLTEKMASIADDPSFERPNGCEVAASLTALAKASDVIVSIGGDGTMLLAARAIARANPEAQLIGVNAGKLGFLSEHPPEEIDSLFDELANGTLVGEERLMLHASLRSDSANPLTVKQDNLDPTREGETARELTLDALNEIVIDNYGSTRMLTLEVYVGDALLGVIRADGIMIATPTGSTGYAVSAGGPIVEPNSPVMLITPIAPHSLNVRPVIVPEGATVRVRAREEETRQEPSPTIRVLVVADGQEQIVVSTPAEVIVRAAPHRLHLLRRSERSFFDLLRTKLFWSADSRDTRR
jgi:NAD+ kinase